MMSGSQAVKRPWYNEQTELQKWKRRAKADLPDLRVEADFMETPVRGSREVLVNRLEAGGKPLNIIVT